jgi:hypothetical protein
VIDGFFDSSATSFGSTSVAITFAPSRANANAAARPMPWPAAVTSAVLPCSRFATDIRIYW